jgi:hypothetical protein
MSSNLPPKPEDFSSAVNQLALMAFFPSDPEVRAALVTVLMDLIETEDQLDWLVNRALRLYAKWPGVAELRALYCSRFKPRDGIESYSTVYLDGIPAESTPLRREPAPLTTADPELRQNVAELAHRRRMPQAKSKR